MEEKGNRARRNREKKQMAEKKDNRKRKGGIQNM